MLSLTATVSAQYASHSVLANGQWWKIGIAHDGLYKIYPNDINELANVAVDRIALFGLPGGTLPTNNSTQHPDDLSEIPIQIADNNNNGVFDNNDYILFFANGPSRWTFSPDYNRFVFSNHPYASLSYVFLTVADGSHRRIGSIQPPSPEGNTVTLCHSVAHHENDITNTHKSGQIWVGERFYGGNTEQSFSLALPATPVGTIKTNIALASVSTAASNFVLTLNGSTRTISFSPNNRYRTIFEEFNAPASSTISFPIKYNYGESMATGYLDYIEIDAITPMVLSGNATEMRTEPLDNKATRYQISGANAATRVWDVTLLDSVTEISVTPNGQTAEFIGIADRWRTYIAFNNEAPQTPVSIARISNQDLHGASNPHLVIVCHSDLMQQAQRLASLHSINDDLDVLVVSQEQVYNEFSSGQKDPMAIRHLMRMFRSRAANNTTLIAPRYLMLFGKGSYDNKNLMNINHSTVVTYQTNTSFDDDGASMATDDVLTYLDNGEGLSNNATMDVAVGRIPAKNASEAAHIVDKIERYMMRADLIDDNIRGDWRNCVALLADDADPSCGGDTNFTSSSEYISRRITDKYPQFTIDKIYADAYVQHSGADGSYYPDVNNALKKRINYGCLLLNYIGHGSSQYIGTERYIMKSDIAAYSNRLQLPFFITSTCTFGRYDDPNETCGAEEFLLADGAGIACLAASRPISHIRDVNADMVLESLNPDNTIGDAVRIAKNKRVTTQALTLIGDPALRLSHPSQNVVVTAINGHDVDTLSGDTALVLSSVTIEGEIQNPDGTLADDFDGYLFPEVYDRPKQSRTLANDNDGYEVDYLLQNNLLYKGRTAVNAGRFSYHFIVPRDVAYKFDKARLSHYAKSSSYDATGAYNNLWLGGFDENVVISETRPDIRLFMNDTAFRNGGITDANPTLLALLHDEKGINAVGSGLGHDITAIIDDNPNSLLNLNDFYETDINNELYGQIKYNLTGLQNGRHTITLKAWNIFNYSNSSTIVFYVHSADTTSTLFVATPNPASERVWLRMEHNCNGSISQAQLDLFDIQGHPVRSWTLQPSADGYVIGPVEWDLRSQAGSRVSPGVYVARFSATTSNGDKIHDHGKIIVK